MIRNFISAIFALFFSAHISAQSIYDLNSKGPISDFAGIIDSASEERLTKQIELADKENGLEFAVVTLNSDNNTEAPGNIVKVLYKRWALGINGRDNGVMVLVIKRNGEMRAVIGYGNDAGMPDGSAIGSISQILTPYFNQGMYGDGILAVIQKLSEYASVRSLAPVKNKGTNITKPKTDYTWLVMFLTVITATGMYIAGLGIRIRNISLTLVGFVLASVPLVIVLTPYLENMIISASIALFSVIMLAAGICLGRKPEIKRKYKRPVLKDGRAARILKPLKKSGKKKV